MKRGIARKIGLGLALAATAFLCNASVTLRDYSARSLSFGPGPEPTPLRQLALWAVGWGCPPSYDACINRLRQIEGAKWCWALEHGITNDVPITWSNIAPYLKRDHLWCPAGGTYRLGTLNEKPKCNI